MGEGEGWGLNHFLLSIIIYYSLFISDVDPTSGKDFFFFMFTNLHLCI